MRSLTLIAISIGLLLASIILSLYFGFFFLFLFLPIGLIWSLFRGNKEPRITVTQQGYQQQFVCSNCGISLAENTNYCPNCGQPVR